MESLSLREEGTHQKLFKVLVVSLIVFHLALVLVPWYILYGNAVDSAMSWSGYGSIISLRYSIIIGNALTLLYFVTYIGLLLYSKWARRVLLLLLGAGVIFIFLRGLSVQPGVEGALGYLMSLFEGAVVALAYFSPLARKFR